MNNILKIFIISLLFALSCVGITISSIYLSTYDVISEIIKSVKIWEYYGFIILLIISISTFILSFIILVEIFYIKTTNKKIKKGDSHE